VHAWKLNAVGNEIHGRVGTGDGQVVVTSRFGDLPLAEIAHEMPTDQESATGRDDTAADSDLLCYLRMGTGHERTGGDADRTKHFWRLVENGKFCNGLVQLLIEGVGFGFVVRRVGDDLGQVDR
jgi:hypothetical protein